MSEPKIAEYVPAISFECPHCGEWNFFEYTLTSDWIDGAACESDVIDCSKCGEEIKVVKTL